MIDAGRDERGAAERKSADRAHLLFELTGEAGAFGGVKGVVRARREFVHDQRSSVVTNNSTASSPTISRAAAIDVASAIAASAVSSLTGAGVMAHVSTP